MAAAALDAEIERYLLHLRVERRVASRTLLLYRSALRTLAADAAADAQPLRQAQAHHVRRWAALLRERGLGQHHHLLGAN